MSFVGGGTVVLSCALTLPASPAASKNRDAAIGTVWVRKILRGKNPVWVAVIVNLSLIGCASAAGGVRTVAAARHVGRLAADPPATAECAFIARSAESPQRWR